MPEIDPRQAVQGNADTYSLLHRVAGKMLPKMLKDFLLKRYWPLKAFYEDWQDYSVELIGYIPLHKLRLFWYRHICGMKIGPYSSIHRQCRLYRPYRVQIGGHSVINYGVLLDGRQGLFIGNNVSISEGTVIITLGHDVDDAEFSLKGAPVVIEDRVFIGAYVRILPGVHIGEGGVVAAGSVVTKDVAPYTVVGGVPALYIRDRSRDLRYELDFSKRFG